MKIQDLLQKNCIITDIKGVDKSEVLSQMARYMASLYNLANPDQIVTKILEREADMSTGIGYGIAIPHARLGNIERLYMIAARSIQGIEFNAIDEQPVHLLFMMISPSNTSTEHTQILSSLSRVMSYEDMRIKLMDAETAEVFLDTLIKGENKYVE